MFTKNFLHVMLLFCPSVICDTCGGLRGFFLLLIFDYDESWQYLAGAGLYCRALISVAAVV